MMNISPYAIPGVTTPNVKSILEELLLFCKVKAVEESEEPPFTPDTLLDIIEDEFCIPVEFLRSRKRERPLPYYRQAYCYYAKILFKSLSLREIGDHINRDHSCVIHSIKTYENLYATKYVAIRTIDYQLRERLKDYINVDIL